MITADTVESSRTENPSSSEVTCVRVWPTTVHASQPRNTSASTTVAATSRRRRYADVAPYRSSNMSWLLTRPLSHLG